MRSGFTTDSFVATLMTGFPVLCSPVSTPLTGCAGRRQPRQRTRGLVGGCLWFAANRLRVSDRAPVPRPGTSSEFRLGLAMALASCSRRPLILQTSVLSGGDHLFAAWQAVAARDGHPPTMRAPFLCALKRSSAENRITGPETPRRALSASDSHPTLHPRASSEAHLGLVLTLASGSRRPLFSEESVVVGWGRGEHLCGA